MAFASKCSLRIPFPNATTDREHYANYREMQRWADRLLRDDERCLETVAEGFRLGFDETRSTGANSVDFYTFSGSWQTPGVAIKFSSFTSSNSFISIPPGIWTIGAKYKYDLATNPTSGEVGLIIQSNDSIGGSVSCREETLLTALQDNFITGEGHGTMATVNYLNVADDIYLLFSNGTDVSIEVTGEIFGVQHSPARPVTVS